MQLKIAAKTEGRVFGLANNGAGMRLLWLTHRWTIYIYSLSTMYFA